MNFIFEFDNAKGASNLVKHGIDFKVAQGIWLDDEMISFPATPHEGEIRWGAIGILDDKFWTAFFTYRDETIRLISVRRSRKSEEKLYESNRSRQEV